MSKIKFIYFDAANTLIHKPDLWLKFDEVLKKYNFKYQKCKYINIR